MKFTKSQDLKLLYSSAEVNSPSKTRIIDMQKGTSHIHKVLSKGKQLIKTPYYLYCINQRIAMKYICFLKRKHNLQLYSLSLCLIY